MRRAILVTLLALVMSVLFVGCVEKNEYSGDSKYPTQCKVVATYGTNRVYMCDVSVLSVCFVTDSGGIHCNN